MVDGGDSLGQLRMSAEAVQAFSSATWKRDQLIVADSDTHMTGLATLATGSPSAWLNGVRIAAPVTVAPSGQSRSGTAGQES